MRNFVPVAKANKAGPVVETLPGRLLGTTEDPEVPGGGVLYGADVNTGEILFAKKLPQPLRFAWAEGTTQWDYQKGPDGFIWTTLGGTLVRIAPADAPRGGRRRPAAAGQVLLRRRRPVPGRSGADPPDQGCREAVATQAEIASLIQLWQRPRGRESFSVDRSTTSQGLGTRNTTPDPLVSTLAKRLLGSRHVKNEMLRSCGKDATGLPRGGSRSLLQKAFPRLAFFPVSPATAELPSRAKRGRDETRPVV